APEVRERTVRIALDGNRTAKSGSEQLSGLPFRWDLDRPGHSPVLACHPLVGHRAVCRKDC
ncbi:hypothetical protein ACQ9AQ_28065, partial [Escherichia coli]|uniref:hypothetical protein n=1 Tax=Escherichia coli TaxID=562 RepID=UPI003D36E83F